MLTPDTIVPDPTNPQSFNRYSYVRNNPVNFTDPTGHRECDFDCQIAQEYTTRDLYRGKYCYCAFDNAPDAIAVGGSASLAFKTPIASVEVNLAVEVVVDVESYEATLFVAPGGDISIGWEDFTGFVKDILETNKVPLGSMAGFTLYGATIHNVGDDVVSNYKGEFAYETTTAAHVVGTTFGEATVPSESQIPSSQRESAYSQMAGLTVGSGFSRNIGRNVYIPVLTVDPYATNFGDFINFEFSEAIALLE